MRLTNPRNSTTALEPEISIDKPQPDRIVSRRHRVKVWFKRLMLLLIISLIIAVSVIGWIGWQFFESSTKVFGGTPLGNAAQFIAPSSLEADSRGRTNILIAGNSVDDPNHPGADLTDSIMILSLNAANDKAYLLSIPRDLWVRIPDYGYSKINAAYSIGNAENINTPGYADDGTGLLASIIQDNFKLRIHYHALVNYTAVRDTVNAVGGIDVNIQSADPRGLYDTNIQVTEGGPLRLSNGVQHLDGQTALNLARARGETPPDGRIGYGFPRGDFDRSIHQQQILAALKGKIVSSDVLLNPFRLGEVFEALGDNIQTDMEINEARRVASILRSIGDGQLKPVSLVSEDSSLLTNFFTADGQAALVPVEGVNDYSEIQRYLQNL